MNGTTNGANGEQRNGDATIKPNDVANKEMASNGGGGKTKDEEKPSSNLKCLEDPNFSFDEAPSHPSNPTANLAASESKGSTEAGGPGKKPSYRVLEDPDVNPLPKPKTTGYKVYDSDNVHSVCDKGKF